MRKKGYKGRCEKKSLSKSKEVCRTYDPLQSKYADTLEKSQDIQEIRCNVCWKDWQKASTQVILCVLKPAVI